MDGRRYNSMLTGVLHEVPVEKARKILGLTDEETEQYKRIKAETEKWHREHPGEAVVWDCAEVDW